MTGYLKAGFLAGIVLFAWCFVSWTMLPWHTMTFRQFGSDVAVSQIIQANATEPGVYMLPSMQQVQSAQRSGQEIKPVMFASVSLVGPTSMTGPMLISLASQIFAAFLVAWMLVRTSKLSYLGRVGFVLVFALAATLIKDVPAWNWFGFDSFYTLVNIADTLVGWLLAGLVLARYAR